MKPGSLRPSRLTRNALFSMVQVVLSAAALLVTYWLLMRALPIAEIGLWSLVVGTTMVARLSEMGLGAGVLRFVAADTAAGREQSAARTIGMAVLAVTLLVGTLALAAAPLLQSYLLGVAPAALHPALAVLLPAALAAVVLGTTANVFLAAIDGCQRMDLRACLQIGSSLLQLAATWFVLPRWGLAGLGLVQVVQSLFLLLAGLAVMAWQLGRPLRDYFGFDRARLRELVFYGGGLQIAAIAQLLFEPLLKVLLTSYSGLALTGYFDMANRIVMQFRSVIVAAYTALVPHIAARSSAGALESEQLRVLYREAFGMLLFVTLPYFACLAAALPLALTLWKGQYDSLFLAIALLQLTGWAVNTLGLPAYMFNTGLGRLRWNIGSHLAIGLTTLLLGPLLGSLLGGAGVLAAGAIALAGGSLLVPWAFHRDRGLRLAEVLPKRRLPTLLLGLAAIAACMVLIAVEGAPGWVMLLGLPTVTGITALGLSRDDPFWGQIRTRLSGEPNSR